MDVIWKSGPYCGANCWVVPDEEGKTAVVIDPAVPYPELEAAAGGKLPEITAILLTHGHFDHMLALRDWRMRTGAPVCIHEGDADCLTDPGKNCFRMFLGKEVVFAPADVLLQDKDTVPGRPDMWVMHTPGHTPGSVVYRTDEAFYTGDTLMSEGGIGRTDLPGGSADALFDSLCQLLSYPLETVVRPGHGRVTTIGEEKPYHRLVK